jgi:hypothetical protein
MEIDRRWASQTIESGEKVLMQLLNGTPRDIDDA